MNLHDEVEKEVEEQVEPTPTDEEQIQAEPTGDGQEVTEEEVPASDDAGAHRKNKGAERRIRQLTRKFRDEQRENQQLKERLDVLEKRVGPKPEPARPNREDYETTEAYEDELFDWRDQVRDMRAEKPAESAAEAPEQVLTPEQEQLIDEFESELETVAPDAIDKVLDGWECSTLVTDFVMSSEKRAELAYHLATNREISDQISNLPPMQAARELAKVEDSLSSKLTGARNEPPPPANTGKPSGTGVTTSQDKMSTNQWVAERRAGRI